MQKKKPKFKSRPSSNPLNNIDLSEFLQPEKVNKKKKSKSNSYQNIKEEYERILSEKLQKEHRAYRVVFKNHPDLIYVAFGKDRGSAKWEAAKYFRESFNPFFAKENCRLEMLNCHAYRCQELDKYGLKGIVPIPELLKALDISLPCSVCQEKHFTYSDYIKGECFIIEGEGDLNPFTKGYILCPKCYKKYTKNK